MENEKQIEEMARDICENCRTLTKCDKDICTMAYKTAEHLTEKNYKKIVMCCECKYCTNDVPTRLLCTYYGENVSENYYCANAKMKGAE